MEAPVETAHVEERPVVARGLSLDDPAVSRLPSDVEVVFVVHPSVLRGTPFEDAAMAQFPFPTYGSQGDISREVLSKTETLVIGHGPARFSASFEGALDGLFDRIVTLASSEAQGVETTGAAGARVLTIGNQAVIHEEGATAFDVRVRVVTMNGLRSPPAGQGVDRSYLLGNSGVR